MCAEFAGRLSRGRFPRANPDTPPTRTLYDAAVPCDARVEHLAAIALPPVLAREDLDFAVALEARGLDPAADARDVDDAVAHHPAIVEQVARGHQPVADMKGEQA